MHRRFFAVVAALSSLAPGATHAAIDFATQIQPIFEARCTRCHGADRQQAKLRLDSGDAIGDFAKDTLLVAGKPDESELYRRITLSADDRKRMPRSGDPLSAEQIELVKQWITEGAKLTVAAADPATDEPETPAKPAEPTPRGEDDPELQALPVASADAIAKIEAAGATVMPLFGESPLLQVSFGHAASPPGDEAIAALADAADQIVWLNLSKAQVSPGGLAGLAKLKNLIRLHLEHSTVNDAGLKHLAGLERLEYLNVYGTSITDAGLEPLKTLAKLRNLYVWQTKVSYDAAQALQNEIPELEVNLGWDHPAVVKQRVAKELETAKKIADDAAARAKELETQYNAAREAQEQAAARLKELEDQLKKLDEPADDEGEEQADDDDEPKEEAKEPDQST